MNNLSTNKKCQSPQTAKLKVFALTSFLALPPPSHKLKLIETHLIINGLDISSQPPPPRRLRHIKYSNLCIKLQLRSEL